MFKFHLFDALGVSSNVLVLVLVALLLGPSRRMLLRRLRQQRSILRFTWYFSVRLDCVQASDEILTFRA